MRSNQDFEDSNFKLNDYLSVVGLSDVIGEPTTLELLTRVIKAHFKTFHYQNILIHEASNVAVEKRKVPSLSTNDILALMTEQKSGYCFQQLELLHAALVALNFDVNRHLAKGIFHHYSEIITSELDNLPKSHELLTVKIDNVEYIADTGSGGKTFRVPLQLKEGSQKVLDDEYRLTKVYDAQSEDDLWLVDTKNIRDDEWFCLYAFYHSPQQLVDINKAHAHIYLAETPIHIRDDLLAIGSVTETKRKNLYWFFKTNSGFFKSIKVDKDDVKYEPLDSFDKFRAVAEKKFGTKI